MNRFNQVRFLLLTVQAVLVFSAQGSVYPGQVSHNRLLAKSFSASVHRCSVGSLDWMACFIRCISDVNCVSYNFNSSRETCELNSFGLESVCGKERLIHSEGVVFQQLRQEKNQLQCLSSSTCAPDNNQVGAESCAKPLASPLSKSCYDIMRSGASQGDGHYQIKPLGQNELLVYCDMTTDGGGWTLVKKTVMDSSSPPSAVHLSGSYRSISQYSKPEITINPSALKDLHDYIEFSQMRWFCYKNVVGRTLHIMTKNDTKGAAVIRYFTDSSPLVPATACNSFTLLPDDTSTLAQNCVDWGSDINFLNEWGSRDNNGQTRIHRDVMMWLQNINNVFFFSMYPSRYLCDDKGSVISVNDTWAFYVR